VNGASSFSYSYFLFLIHLILVNKLGFVNIFGRPNAGKSTLLNALMERSWPSCRPKCRPPAPHQGILTEKEYQIIFSTLPVSLNPGTNCMKKDDGVKNALEDADVALLLVDMKRTGTKRMKYLPP
jgi:GTP-binding protein Era